MGRVHVLELVDREVAVAPVHPLGEAGVVVEQVGGTSQDVVEVEGVFAGQRGLVLDEGLFDPSGGERHRPLGPEGGLGVGGPG